MGLIIVGVFIIYSIVGIVISLLAYKFTKKAKYSILVIIFFALFPTWDLLIQKAVKEYYVTFKMEPKIYSMPEFDKNGKIESLGLVDVTLRSESRLKEKNIYNYYSNYISDYIEITVTDYKPINAIKKVKVYLNRKNNKFKYIETINAKYQVVSLKPKTYMLGLFRVKSFYIMNNDKKLAESILIDFTNNFAYFRENILFLQSGSGVGMYNVKGINNLDETMKKVFNISNSFYIRKGL